MLAYSYNEITREYTGSEEADESPLEPGVFLIPANAVSIAPPDPMEGYRRVWNDTEWDLVLIPPPPAIPEPLPPTAEEVRAERNGRLFASDYTQLSDVPISNRSAWVTYRQALRDVPEQAGFPEEVIWPTKPEYIKT